MKIVITYCDKGNDYYLPLIQMAFASAKRFGYETVLVGNKEIDGADYFIQMPSEPHLMCWIVAAQVAYMESPLFSCDSMFFSPDALIVKDIRPIFDGFDVGFTTRSNKKWPINNGVIFISPKNKDRLVAFWKNCLEICRGYSDSIKDWYGDQQCLDDGRKSDGHGLNIKELPCDNHNASPNSFEPGLLKFVYVVHFKGKRKDLMKQYWEAIK